ncbi:hypothetical protein COCON_G00057720 [Conger conger]|uniref:WD repeat-containing protein 18 n=1 Tax=Conger conger TaxID=82655 RepID=A0A9Q1I347_CONCO|nr:hypothetical protein COCON_G00057720 [Conger conger]
MLLTSFPSAKMSAPMEVIVCADSAEQLWNCAVFELHSGTNLLSYRGGNTSARSLTVLNGEYILGGQLGKNFINVWEIQRKDQLQQKIVCPGIVTCLAASPNGLILLAGIAEAIYVWEVSTGNLLAILSRHYQDLTCLRFTDDSSHFVSGGKDNLALVWNLTSVVQLDSARTPEPRHIWTQHSLPITDIHCGLMGPQARVATASLDQTVKLWEISSGEMLLSVLFDVGIMSVTLDPCEYSLFCGGSDGSIFQVSLCSTHLSRDKTFQSDGEGNQVFKGHRTLVTCLSVSMDGTLLLSGSHDETVRLWDIQSRQSIRSMNHKGPVTSAFIMPAPANMLLPESQPGGAGRGHGERRGVPPPGTQPAGVWEKACVKLPSAASLFPRNGVWGGGGSRRASPAPLGGEVRASLIERYLRGPGCGRLRGQVDNRGVANGEPLSSLAFETPGEETGQGGGHGTLCFQQVPEKLTEGPMEKEHTTMCVVVGATEETYLKKAEKLYSLMCAVTDKSVFGDGENTKVRVSELEEEVKTLKKINKDLYDFSTQLLTKPS